MQGGKAENQANRAEEDAPFREGQASNCNKNVSLGSMDRDKLFLAIPDWALKWYEKNRKRFPRICFSDSLMPGAKNYLVVFYMAPPHAPASESFEKVSSPGEATGGSETGGFSASYGSTWHYIYEHAVTTTILYVSAEKAPHNQPSFWMRWRTRTRALLSPITRRRLVRQATRKHPTRAEKGLTSSFQTSVSWKTYFAT